MAEFRERELKAVILDMDGLMVDSEPSSHQAWCDVLTTFGVTLKDEDYLQVIGWRLDETAKFLQNTYRLPVQPGDLGKIKENRLSQIRRDRGVQPMPGLLRLVDGMRDRGLPWAVATSSKRSTAEEIMARLGLSDSCQAVAGGDEVLYGKPSPDIYLLAAERLDIAPKLCLALEDSLPGFRSAQSAGMVTVAVPGRHTNPTEFKGANYIFPNLNGVLDQLDTLVGMRQ